MNRDIFRRHTRFTHTFGELEKRADPMGSRTFEFEVPERVNELHTGSCEVQEYGEHRWNDERSAVSYPSGRFATLEGPTPDMPFMLGVPIPQSTKGRKSKD